jgi:cytochrome d ubiquinol oxidase subunit II
VAFANIFSGIPIDPKGIYQGNLFTLLHPYGLLGGVLFVILFLVHGSLWLCIRSEGDLQKRAASTASVLWPVEVGVAVIFLFTSAFATKLYSNYLAYPLLFAVILLTVAALFGIRIFLAKKAYFKAWAASAVTIVGATFYGVIGLFPNMFPSSIDPAFSLTAHNAASSQLTLKIMLVVVIIFVPIVLAYQAWAYNLFKTKVTTEDMVY